ncbi:hypothetical protein [Porphyromonas sp.]|uniref:hypothetical protein n=1 Tax=Porphyromonas sp. TaxID=1924944 RepID=UPI0026DC1A18|nr:hypothetical protein [Porphyromonas sp.]MDO4771221.1 hypothetical protein [Porphyromonas sp.]
MEANKKIKELSIRLGAAMREMEAVRQELLSIDNELKNLYRYNEESETESGNVFVGVKMPTFTPVNSDEAAASRQIDVSVPSGSQLSKRMVDYISVIDIFRFQCELFGNDSEEMHRVFTELEGLSSFTEGQDYISRTLLLDPQREIVADLLRMIAPYYTERD